LPHCVAHSPGELKANAHSPVSVCRSFYLRTAFAEHDNSRKAAPASDWFVPDKPERVARPVVNQLFTPAKVPLTGFTLSVRAFNPYLCHTHGI
jgi:hypothetical protein